MKASKSVLLVLLAALFILSALFFQAAAALNATVFSGWYFNLQFDRSVQPEDLEQLAAGITDNAEAFMPLSAKDRKALADGTASKELKAQVNDFRATLREAVDGKWFADEAPRLAKGLFAYLTGSAGKLPGIGIAPLKEALVGFYAGRAMAGEGQGLKEFEAFILQVELTAGGFSKDGKANETAVTQLMQMGQLLSMDMKKDTARDVCVKIGSRAKEGTTTQELLDYTVKAVARDMVDAAGVSDRLDLDVLVREAYGKQANPVTGFPVMLGGLRLGVLALCTAVFLLIAGAIAVLAARRKDILRWLGVPLIVSGVAGLAMAVGAALLAAAAGNLVPAVQTGSPRFDLSFLRDLAANYTGGVALFLFVQSAVFVTAGALMNARANRSAKGREARSGSSGQFKRVIVTLALLAAIPLSALLIGKAMLERVESYDRIVKASARQEADFGGALIKALGITEQK